MPFRLTKIIATIGPASSSTGTLRRMVAKGVTAFRINTAHGSAPEYEEVLRNVRSISGQVPIIVDIKGPDLRIKCKTDVHAKKGGEIEIGFSQKGEIFFDKNFYSKAKIGAKVFFEDGRYASRVIAKKYGRLVLRFLNDAVLKNNKNVNVPGLSLNLPCLSKKDLQVIKWVKRRKLKFLALSFCRSAADVKNLRKKAGKDAVIIAKIESREGVGNFASILSESDGIMVARGDLGVEMGREAVPLLQKRMIRESINSGKFCIVATQMLESMIENPYPSRAEVNDIANSVLDGADCLMLSGETSIGANPLAAVAEMRKAADAVEGKVQNFVQMGFNNNVSDSITKSIFQLSKYLRVNRIVALTRGGYTARMISRFRSPIPIIALCWNELALNLLTFYFGVFPSMLSQRQKKLSHNVLAVVESMGLVKKGDTLIITGNVHTAKEKHSNLIEVHKVE